MFIRVGLIGFCSCAILRVASAQDATDPEILAAHLAWARNDYPSVIASTTRVLDKEGSTVNTKFAEVRFMRAAAWCRTVPATINTRGEGKKQLGAVRSDLNVIMSLALLTSTKDTAASLLAQRVMLEQSKCTNQFDEPPSKPMSFGSLGVRPRTSSGSAGVAGTAIIVNAGNGTTGGPGVSGILREADPGHLLFQGTGTTFAPGTKGALDMLDLQMKQLQTQQQMLRLQRDAQTGGGLQK